MKRIAKIGIALTLGVSIIGAAVGLSHVVKPSQPIYAFDLKRDYNDIMTLMKNNWYWLISSPDYNADFMLRHKAPSHKDPRYFGKLQIKVLRPENKFAGFVAFYKKYPGQGQLLFLAVDKDFRGKRYGNLLMDHALGEMKQQGITRVSLVTRVSNYPAQEVYKRAGFDEIGRDETFVYYEKDLAD